MVSSRKRTIDEVTGNGPESEGHSLLHRIRNMWQFANLCQWVYIFGKIVKIDDRFGTEEIETECLKPNAPALQEIGLALLKSLSSHRGLTPELFDEYTRRQYVSKAPEKPNPFGAEETPASFASFDVFTKIRILQQMTSWVMRNPEKVREKMEESKDSEQTQWRIEPMGWDSDDRTYFVLDDNRVYRLTDAPLEPTPTPKKKSKASRKGGRSSKRRRVSAAQTTTEDAEDAEAQDDEKPAQTEPEPEDDGFGGQKWECLAVTLDEVRDLITSFRKTRDENEKVLRDQLEEHLLPILEKQEESRKRKEVQRERELLNLAKMANAKRSSRLANKQEQQEHDKKAREEDERRRIEEIAERKAEKERLKLEKERDQRLASRENRLKDREARRQQHEEELASLSEDSRQTSEAPGRMSERRLHVEIERRKLALQEIAAEDEEDDWIFDCVCGVYGQVDDGTHSVACEKCNVWQHSKCLGISEDEAEQSDFHFVCSTCRQKEEPKSKPRTTIKLKINRPGSSTQTSPANETPALGSGSVVVAIPSRLNKPNEAQSSDPMASPAVVATTEASHDGVVATKASDNYPRTGQSSSFNIAIDAEAVPTDTKTNGIVPVTPGFSFPSRNEEPTLPYSNGSPSKRSMGRPGSRSPVHELGIHSSPIMGGASLLSTPGMKRDGGDAMPPSTLPSSEAGHSPTKHSPVVPRPESASSAFSKTSNFPAVFPPLTTLAPSPRQPILTPPTKQTTEPARPPPPEFVRPAEGSEVAKAHVSSILPQT